MLGFFPQLNPLNILFKMEIDDWSKNKSFGIFVYMEFPLKFKCWMSLLFSSISTVFFAVHINGVSLLNFLY